MAGGLVVFVVAALTDWLDGYLARKFNQTVRFGRNFDPLVDKVLICGAFIFLLAGRATRLAAAVDGDGRRRPRAAHHRPARLPGDRSARRSGPTGSASSRWSCSAPG